MRNKLPVAPKRKVLTKFKYVVISVILIKRSASMALIKRLNLSTFRRFLNLVVVSKSVKILLNKALMSILKRFSSY